MLDRNTPPPIYTMGTLKLPVPQTERLSNGITMHTVNGGSQDVNQISLTWPGGVYEAKNPAVARIMDNTIREGTSKMSGAEISEWIDFNGAMLKIFSDAHYTTINISALNSKTANILLTLHDIICDATIPEGVFQTFKDIEIKEHLLQQSKVMTLSNDALAPMIKGKHHPSAHVLSVDEINSVTHDEVRNYYKKVFTASGCNAYISGNLTEDILQEIRKMLESLPANHPAVPLDIVPYMPEAPGITEVIKPDALQAAVCMGLPAPARSHPDYIPLRFAVCALGGYFGSRLMKNIREDKGYTYGIGSYLLGSQEGSYTLITAQADKKYVEALIEEVRTELRRLAEDPIGDEEMMRLKQHISSSLMETMDSPFSIMDYYRTIECVGLPKGYFESQVDWVHKINAATIMEMAQRYIDGDALRIAVCR